MIRTLVAYGVALLPVMIVAVVILAAAALVLRRKRQTGRRIVVGLVVGAIVVLPLVYVLEGLWLGRYGLATMHLVEVCGPVEGVRTAWHLEVTRAGSLNADGFFSCATGLNDPEIMCHGRSR